MKSKNIILTHKSYNDLGVFEKVSIERWKLLNPEYDVLFFTNEEADWFVYRLFPDYVDTYKKAHLGAQNNIKRACIIYDIGGLYVDCDTYPVKPLREFGLPEKDEVVFAHLGRNLLCNHMLGAAKGSQLPYQIAEGGLKNLASSPPPVIQEQWAGWHFDTTGVHHYNECYARAGHTVESSQKGCWYHSSDLRAHNPDDVCTVHYGVASWHSGREVEPERKQHDDLARIKEHFNQI